MSVNNINQVGRVSQTTGVASPEFVQESRRRIELHTQDVMARGGSQIDFSSFQSSVSPDDQVAIRSMFESFPPEQQAALQQAAMRLANELMTPGAVSSTGSMSSGLQGASTTALTTYLAGAGADAQSNVNQGFMNMALAGMESKLKDFAKGVEANTQIGKELRTTVTEIQDMLTNWPEGTETQEFSWQEVSYDDAGNPTVTDHTADMTKEQFEALRDKLDMQLSNCQDMGELKKFDLQQIYQDYTQAVQTLGNIQKQIHDDAKAILNNMRA